MTVKLYVIPISHAAMSARLMLDYKGIEHETVELLSGLHPIRLRMAGFDGGTVPALRAEGRWIQGSRSISRYLDAVCPEPPLFPADPELCHAVEDAEEWGAEVLQHVPRRLFRWALDRNPETRRLLARANGLPCAVLMGVVMKPLAAYFARYSAADDETVRRHLAELPALLDHADELVEHGVIGTSTPNAATFQIGPSLRLLMNFRQLEPLFADRPAARFARELLPEYPGEVSTVFPTSWIITCSSADSMTTIQEHYYAQTH